MSLARKFEITFKSTPKIYDFVAETGPDIDATFQRLEKANFQSFLPRLTSDRQQNDSMYSEATHLSRHGITEVARGRMIDWIYEVLMAYKMSE